MVRFFFFQAEDGIRDYKVTGVQTCALPICLLPLHLPPEREGTDRVEVFGETRDRRPTRRALQAKIAPARENRSGIRSDERSEERRVGKECGSRWREWDYKETD